MFGGYSGLLVDSTVAVMYPFSPLWHFLWNVIWPFAIPCICMPWVALKGHCVSSLYCGSLVFWWPYPLVITVKFITWTFLWVGVLRLTNNLQEQKVTNRFVVIPIHFFVFLMLMGRLVTDGSKINDSAICTMFPPAGWYLFELSFAGFFLLPMFLIFYFYVRMGMEIRATTTRQLGKLFLLLLLKKQYFW